MPIDQGDIKSVKLVKSQQKIEDNQEFYNIPDYTFFLNKTNLKHLKTFSPS